MKASLCRLGVPFSRLTAAPCRDEDAPCPPWSTPCRQEDALSRPRSTLCEHEDDRREQAEDPSDAGPGIPLVTLAPTGGHRRAPRCGTSSRPRIAAHPLAPPSPPSGLPTQWTEQRAKARPRSRPRDSRAAAPTEGAKPARRVRAGSSRGAWFLAEPAWFGKREDELPALNGKSLRDAVGMRPGTNAGGRAARRAGR
jgi:hypothetical protein